MYAERAVIYYGSEGEIRKAAKKHKIVSPVGRKKLLPVIENVRITDIGAEGNALSRIDNMVVFVPMLIPGDIVDIQIIRKRKKYLEGRVIRFREYSPTREKPRCSHFGVCGGCRWQHLPYENQLYHKEKQVKENLERIGKTEIPVVMPILGSPDTYYYRNKLEYTFSDRRWLTPEEIISDVEYAREEALGFHIRGLFDKILDIRECFLQPEPSNMIRDAVRDYAIKDRMIFFNARQQTGFLRNLVIRNNLDGKFMVIIVFFYEDRKRREGLLDHLASKFPGIVSLMYVINSKKNDSLTDQEPVLYKGEDHLTEVIEGLKFRIGPKTFFQTNTTQAVELYRTAKSFAGLTGGEIVYDLYTGAGTIAGYVADSAKKVIGIEFVEDAVKDAIINSKLNGITNTVFFAGDIKSVMTDSFIYENGKPDVVITDPPRAGMPDDVIKTIIGANPGRIVYISCNPATQARDVSMLSDHYKVTKVQPFDMFPQTHHVENVVLLEKI